MDLRNLIVGLLTVMGVALHGQSNKALNLEQSGYFMEIPNSEDFFSEHFTLEMWIKRHPAIDNSISTYPVFSGRSMDITLGRNRFPQQISLALEGENGLNIYSNKGICIRKRIRRCISYNYRPIKQPF